MSDKIISEEEAAEKIRNSGWNVFQVKFMKGHDADSMECTLLKVGVPVAVVWDDSYGGEFQYTWEAEDLYSEIDQFGKSLNVYCENFKKGMKYNADIVVDILVQNFMELEELTEWCKTMTVFKLKGSAKGEYRTIKSPFAPAVVDYIKKKFGNKVERIINEEMKLRVV